VSDRTDLAYHGILDTLADLLARLGVIHSQVFSGFSGKATADRIVDSESRVLRWS
jgi:acyl-coenzyme A synthetase/AMP-(fatty) acid ligase